MCIELCDKCEAHKTKDVIYKNEGSCGHSFCIQCLTVDQNFKKSVKSG